MITNIYGLYNEYGEIRYVGLTKGTLPNRLIGHLKGAKRFMGGSKVTHCFRWIQSMLDKGVIPTIKIIAIVPSDGKEAERFYIAYFKMLGVNLTNLTEGGDCGFGWTSEMAKKGMETRRKNGTLTTSLSAKKSAETRRSKGIMINSSMVLRGWQTKKDNGYKHDPELFKKGWETRRKDKGLL